MRTAKLLSSALALAIIITFTEPAFAADSNSTGAAIRVLPGSELNQSNARSEAVLAGMVALLAALLLLRRNHEAS